MCRAAFWARLAFRIPADRFMTMRLPLTYRLAAYARSVRRRYFTGMPYQHTSGCDSIFASRAMHFGWFWFVMLGLLWTFPNTGHAQEVLYRNGEFAVQGQQNQPSDRTYGLGIGLGLTGFLSGAFAGHALTRGCGAKDGACNFEAIFYGAAAGGTFGMALGVHLGNMRQGNLGLDFLTGAAIWGAGIGIAAASQWNEPVGIGAFIVIPIAQLFATVAVERAIGKKRSSNQRVNFSVSPQVNGGAVIAWHVAY